MNKNEETAQFAINWAQVGNSIQLVSAKEQCTPGAVQYSIKRFSRNEEDNSEDFGIINYDCQGDSKEQSALKLRFCVAGNMYCASDNCQKCTSGNAKRCLQSIPSYDVLSVDFSALQLSQFVSNKTAATDVEALIQFNEKESFNKNITLCCKTKSVIDALVNHQYSGSLENIYVNAQLQMLLLYSMDTLFDKGDAISCRFLNSETDREKVAKARNILLQSLGDPITIKELSRKVAMNECYLKKGFKEMFGSTIFEFYQSQRMEHAKYLLYEKGLNVTDVSIMLGYSSISHFSTAFKKQTGLKPCELLLR